MIYMLRMHYVPDSVLGAQDTAVKNPVPFRLCVVMESDTVDMGQVISESCKYNEENQGK